MNDEHRYKTKPTGTKRAEPKKEVALSEATPEQIKALKETMIAKLEAEREVIGKKHDALLDQINAWKGI